MAAEAALWDSQPQGLPSPFPIFLSSFTVQHSLPNLFHPQKHHKLSKTRVLKEAAREGGGRLEVFSGTHSPGIAATWVCSMLPAEAQHKGLLQVQVHSPGRPPGSTGPLLCISFPVSQFATYTGACSSPRAGFAIPLTELDVSFTPVLQIVKIPLASSLTSSTPTTPPSCVSLANLLKVPHHPVN